MEDNPFKILNPDSTSKLVLTCEHASNRIPDAYKNLGLPLSELNRHIARDKGVAELTAELAKQLNCFAILGGYSRLLIDLNRGIDENELIVTESDETIIPGNLNLTPEERNYRIKTFYQPYYDCLNKKIENLTKSNQKPILFSIHSFTPQLKGGSLRPWNAGILYHKPQPFANFLLSHLKTLTNKNIGENVPYDLQKYNTGAAVFCGEMNGFDYALIEIKDSEFENMRQGVQEWANLLLPLLKEYTKF